MGNRNSALSYCAKLIQQAPVVTTQGVLRVGRDTVRLTFQHYGPDEYQTEYEIINSPHQLSLAEVLALSKELQTRQHQLARSLYKSAIKNY